MKGLNYSKKIMLIEHRRLKNELEWLDETLLDLNKRVKNLKMALATGKLVPEDYNMLFDLCGNTELRIEELEKRRDKVIRLLKETENIIEEVVI